MDGGQRGKTVRVSVLCTPQPRCLVYIKQAPLPNHYTRLFIKTSFYVLCFIQLAQVLINWTANTGPKVIILNLFQVRPM